MLIRAVKSVARQTYQDVEIIIVDDGCKYDVEASVRTQVDSTACRVVKNMRTPGAPGARNTGFYESRGDYVGFLDDDDEWMPEKIEKQVAAFRVSTDRVGIVCTEDIVVDGTGRNTRQINLEGNVFSILCSEHVAGNTSNPLIKRDVFEEVGLFDEELISGQDTDLWLRIAKRYHFTTVKEPLAIIHRDGTERITKSRRKQIFGMFTFLRKHWADLHPQRKYRLAKRIIRLSVASLNKNFARSGR
jgi:glycosyltransferase involved in cell wall biosynthesis